MIIISFDVVLPIVCAAAILITDISYYIGQQNANMIGLIPTTTGQLHTKQIIFFLSSHILSEPNQYFFRVCLSIYRESCRLDIDYASPTWRMMDGSAFIPRRCDSLFHL